MRTLREKNIYRNAKEGVRVLSDSELERIRGAFDDFVNSDDSCKHKNGVKTGNWDRHRIAFFTWTNVEYYCPDCKARYYLTELFE